MWPKKLSFIAALFCSVSFAFSKDTDDVTCIPEGPVSGCVAEELPDAKVKKEMVDETNKLSNYMSNSPGPVHANQLACESDEANETCEVTGKNINLANFQGNGKIDVPTGAPPSPLYSEWNKVLMPDLHLNDIEINALVEYMDAETYKVVQGGNE